MLTGVGHDPDRVPDGVEVLGSVSAGELVSLYRRAAALVFPSLYEGFGLPPVEAMACGCPVAASSAARSPRSSGTPCCSTRSTPRRSPAAWRRRSTVRPSCASGGLARAQFTWDATARAHDAVYELATSA